MNHAPECTEWLCYCFDESDPDPMCDCGHPGYACRCDPVDDADSYSVDDVRPYPVRR